MYTSNVQTSSTDVRKYPLAKYLRSSALFLARALDFIWGSRSGGGGEDGVKRRRNITISTGGLGASLCSGEKYNNDI